MPILIERFMTSDSGATAIEYGMIAGLVFLAIVGAVQGLGNGVVNVLYVKLATIL